MIDVQGRQLELSNIEKVLYPKTGFTKGQLIDYYIRIAPVLLPHLKGRPLTMKRYPNGVSAPFFYEKNCPVHRPDWVTTTPVWSDGNNRWMDYCTVSDLATIVWVANLASIELHTSLSHGKKIETPTYIVFDLDPGPPANIVKCCQVGLWVRAVFDKLGLESFAKTSGSKGLQIYVPLNTPITYEQTKPFAKGIARMLETAHPNLVVSDMKKSLRTNKVFVDWSQNDQYKTTVNVYSMRAKEQPTVSTPVTWKEVEQCLKKEDPDLLVFTSDQTLARVEKNGDLWESLPTMKQKLPPIERLEGLSEGSSKAAKTSKPSRRKKVA
jgi:bifunctional non-homologous end joining protein LigD